MESVRWVLGESSAKEMRADAMDAVIFNGSANRKPISRASVELIFDNSLGGANGEWSQYAEISVKRVIEREKGSSYFINNTPVRRRDVADLFLGTGLGGRAYAIIGQNTISRIVEAKPEELRIFLEEAAGISKYKDRRRETELRLKDARENLTRVEDVCRELQKQIHRLASQAVVAEKYNQLQTTFKHAEGQLWLLKKRDASAAWEKSKAQVDTLVNQLEAQMAALRACESRLETTRQLHYAASEGINVAQAYYYEANAEVSNLENQLKQTHEARERMNAQLQQLHMALERNALVFNDLQLQLATKNSELTLVETDVLNASQMFERLSQGLPQKDADLKQSAELANTSQQALIQAKQRIQIEQNNLQHQMQLLQETQQRISRYQNDLSVLAHPQETDLTTFEAQNLEHQQSLSAQEQVLHKIRDAESNALSDIAQLRTLQTQAQQAHSHVEAEIRTLAKLQQSIPQESKLDDWLLKAGLVEEARLWQHIEVQSEWNTALEAVLGAKLNALIASYDLNQQRPPGALVLALAHKSSMPCKINHHLTPLLSVIVCKTDTLHGVLQDWLSGVYLLTHEQDKHTVLNQLLAGECLVNQNGDIYTQHSISFYGAGLNPMQGVLERQQQLSLLNQQLPKLKQSLEQISATLIQKENDLQSLRSQQQAQNQAIKHSTAQMHQLQMQISQIKQAQAVAQQRQISLQHEINNAQVRQQSLLQTQQKHEAQLAQLTQSLPALEIAETLSRAAKLEAEKTYFALRDEIQAADKSHQEHLFSKKIIINLINEINDKIKVNIEEKSAFLQRQSETENTLKLTPMDALKANLTQALNKKQNAEKALANARNQLAEQDHQLQQQERERLQQEQQLHPLRDALEQSRLQAQEARLQFEHCTAGLTENGLEESLLAPGLTPQTKASELSNKTKQLQQAINALGAVNLAAIQELATEQERKLYLDSQMRDLTEASNTLEQAIHKIDKETRGKLQATYDEANRNFNELFNVLFGGGQARLELLGDEILDTGIQVFAQPPGKKNSTIQLLSGGEKALTAIALVFALFRLNPAPFCLMDEVDAPLDDSNTERFCSLVKKMSEKTQFLFVSHNKVTMEMAQQLIGVTMQESGVSRVVDVDIDSVMRMQPA